MSQYLILSHIDIQNANSIAGLTWGFPAITHFLGFTHALNRRLSNDYNGNHDISLTGCGVVSHKINNKVYQPKQYADFEFIQSKNPPVLEKHKNSSPSIIEEGKMNLTISLVIELDKDLVNTTEEIKELESEIMDFCLRMRIAGGTVLNINRIKLLSANTQKQQTDLLRKIKRLTMPGFVLLDQSHYLEQHYQTLITQHKNSDADKNLPQLLDAWLDFSALKFKAIPESTKDQNQHDENTPAQWEYFSKPNSGYLVPLMVGYKAISELYGAGEVLNTRDEISPSRFVEAIHSIGEWKGIFSIKDITNIIWRYQHKEQWYLCTQEKKEISNEINLHKEEQTQILNINDALNKF